MSIILKIHRPFDLFDTVEVEFDYSQKLRGYLVHYYKKIGNFKFDSVVLVFNNDSSPSFLGSQIKINLCRMVLFEKFDYKREYAFETVDILKED